MTHRHEEQGAHQQFWLGVARAFGGALIFSFPLLLTMEMWWFGYATRSLHLTLLLMLNIPLLAWLAHVAGFEKSVGWKDNVLGAFVAYAAAYVAAALMLFVFGVLTPDLSLDVVVGLVAIQAVPGSIGASVARSQFGVSQEHPDHPTGYGVHLVNMIAGAVYLSLTVVCTMEMIQIAQMMTVWHSLALMAVSLGILHAFVRHFFRVETVGGSTLCRSEWQVLLQFTVVGYSLALLVGSYLLWTFGRLEGLSAAALVQSVIVVAFPASLGAGAARVIL
jgi:putative integral membrane protein (TIGR02587 family)